MGRGSSGKPYGTEYKSLYKAGNIKFIQYVGASNSTAPRITQTKGRVYVTINGEGKPAYITYFNNDLKRSKNIDLLHVHAEMMPHTHHGYNHNENDGKKGAANLTPKEKKMVARILDLWYNRKSK